MSPEAAGRMRALLRDGMDWPYLIETAQWHGIMPLLCRSLERAGPEAVPAAVLKALQDHFHDNARRNRLLAAELVRLLRLFQENGVPAVPFKGPALAASAYGDLALRQFGDLDVLVRKEDVLKARDLLVSSGYAPEQRLAKALAPAYLEYGYELCFMRRDRKLMVELHWEIAPSHFLGPFAAGRLWKGLNLEAAGDALPELPPEHTLLILCIHGAKHSWRQLSLVCDAAELLRSRSGMNWGRLMETTGVIGLRRMLFLGLLLAKHLLDAPVPGEVLRRIESDPAAGRLCAEVKGSLFNAPGSLPGLLGTCLFHLKARERLQDRLRYCLRLALTPSPGDWAFAPLPAPLFFLYYFLRPVRLAVGIVRTRGWRGEGR